MGIKKTQHAQAIFRTHQVQRLIMFGVGNQPEFAWLGSTIKQHAGHVRFDVGITFAVNHQQGTW